MHCLHQILFLGNSNNQIEKTKFMFHIEKTDYSESVLVAAKRLNYYCNPLVKVAFW